MEKAHREYDRWYSDMIAQDTNSYREHNHKVLADNAVGLNLADVQKAVDQIDYKLETTFQRMYGRMDTMTNSYETKLEALASIPHQVDELEKTRARNDVIYILKGHINDFEEEMDGLEAKMYDLRADQRKLETDVECSIKRVFDQLREIREGNCLVGTKKEILEGLVAETMLKVQHAKVDEVVMRYFKEWQSTLRRQVRSLNTRLEAKEKFNDARLRKIEERLAQIEASCVAL